MHIKQVVLAGFKSYRDKTTVEEIDPGLNVIVGKNGTGKSNIFNAIRFVLDDGDTENLRNTIGSQRGQESYVELFFDNSDSRFLTFDEDVCIKRSLDTPADFWINGKKTPKSDVMNYLESAGFGRYNPFYVVPQGKVASLINATDEERLELLLTASGLDLFERKKKQAQKSINKSLKDIDHVEVTLSEINDRLETLQEEILISSEYQEVQLEQRQLKFQQLKREQAMVSEILHECSTKLENLRHVEAEVDATLLGAQKSQQTKEARISELKCTIDTIGAQLDFENLTDTSDKQQRSEDPQAYDELIAQAEAEINEKTNELGKIKVLLEVNNSRLSDATSKLKGLQLKLSQSSKFSSIDERNEWLKEQINHTNMELEAQKSLQTTLTNDINGMDIPMVSTDYIDSLSSQLQNAKKVTHEEQSKLQDAQVKLKSAQLSSRKNHILVESIQEQISSIVNNTSDNVLIDAVEAIDQARKFAEDLGVSDKFYGPLANLMTLDETYTSATEAIAKSSLLYCVVEDSETARVLAGEMVTRNAGRLSFIPLAEITNKPVVTLEEEDKEQAVALIDMIECEEKFKPAISLIIGSALLCEDIETGWRCSRAYNVDCVTIEGSLVSPYGALRGGSLKVTDSSRFTALALLSEVYDRKSKALAEVYKADEEINCAQQQVTSAHNLVTESKKLVTLIYTQLEDARREYTRACIDLEGEVKVREYKQLQLERGLREINRLTSLKQGFELELDAEFAEPLSHEEEEQVRTLSEELADAQAQNLELEKRISDTQRSLDELKAQKWDAELSKDRYFSDARYETSRNGVKESDIGTLQATRAGAIKEQASLRLELQNIISENTETAARLFRIQKEIKKQEFREDKYSDLLRDSERQSRQLGISEAQEFDALTDAQIEERSQEVQSKINRFGPINQFAQEQYNRYKHEHRKETQNRDSIAKDLEDSQKMITQLDGYKSKAIIKTFKDVEARFTTFFKHLTRTDTAKLHVDGKDPLEWKGLEITVSFARHRQLRIEQLSGGQKALCALAFLLSLQATDPAPFYIFDEVDASLDTQYRGSLAETLQQISSKLSAQFICTTFSPELVQKADKIYGTAFANNTSTAGAIDRELALSLVDVSGQDVSRVLG